MQPTIPGPDLPGTLTAIGALLLAAISLITVWVTRRTAKDTLGVDLLREIRAEKAALSAAIKEADTLIGQLRDKTLELASQLHEVKLDRSKLRAAKDRVIEQQRAEIGELREDVLELREQLVAATLQLEEGRQELVNSRAVSAEAISELAAIRGQREVWRPLPSLEMRNGDHMQVRESG